LGKHNLHKVKGQISISFKVYFTVIYTQRF